MSVDYLLWSSVLVNIILVNWIFSGAWLRFDFTLTDGSYVSWISFGSIRDIQLAMDYVITSSWISSLAGPICSNYCSNGVFVVLLCCLRQTLHISRGRFVFLLKILLFNHNSDDSNHGSHYHPLAVNPFLLLFFIIFYFF